MNARETFAYHMTKALAALGKCDIGFVCQETRRAKALLVRAKAERAATLAKDGMRECDMIHEGAPQNVLTQARVVLGTSVVPFKHDCKGASVGDRYANILDEMRQPGNSVKVPIPQGLTQGQFGNMLRHRAFMRGIRLSVLKKGMPKGILSVTCTDHADHRQQQRRLATQSS